MNSATDGSTGPLSGRPVGVVLAGGTSRRMGRDKALLPVLGETLSSWAARRLAPVCAEVVVADQGRGLLPGLPSLPDGPGRGPAAGLLGAAAARPGRPLLVLACDLPAVPAGLLAEIAAAEDVDGAFPRWRGGIEPLCALYGPAALAALADRVRRGLWALHDLPRAPGLSVRFLDEAELVPFGPPEEVFLNLNTPEDWERYVAAGAISRRKS
jgi:molybdopterin-guanine dinucleotide biosynthesis protein A